MTHLTPNIASPFSKQRNDLEKNIPHFQSQKRDKCISEDRGSKRCSPPSPKGLFPRALRNRAKANLPGVAIERRDIYPIPRYRGGGRSSTPHKRDKEQIKLKEAFSSFFPACLVAFECCVPIRRKKKKKECHQQLGDKESNILGRLK